MSQTAPTSVHMLAGETLVPFSELPDQLPKRNGRKISTPTIYRWKQVGLSGVKLEVAYIAGIAHTSLEAIDRFNERVTAAKLGPSTIPLKSTSTSKQVERAHERAVKKLAKRRSK